MPDLNAPVLASRRQEVLSMMGRYPPGSEAFAAMSRAAEALKDAERAVRRLAARYEPFVPSRGFAEDDG
jgi:hypothetical protein